VIADVGTSIGGQAVLRQMRRDASKSKHPPSLLLIAGDIAYSNGDKTGVFYVLGSKFFLNFKLCHFVFCYVHMNVAPPNNVWDRFQAMLSPLISHGKKFLQSELKIFDEIEIEFCIAHASFQCRWLLLKEIMMDYMKNILFI
jgi:hypothetical protein